MTVTVILYIEDNSINANLLTKRLHKRNVLVIVAESGTKGFEMAIRHQPAVILMDYNLPDKNGIAVTQRLKRNSVTKHIPVIMLTADAADATRIAAQKAGVDGFLLKPVTLYDLMHALNNVVGDQIT
jgi:CheY-like chemotaxis protein